MWLQRRTKCKRITWTEWESDLLFIGDGCLSTSAWLSSILEPVSKYCIQSCLMHSNQFQRQLFDFGISLGLLSRRLYAIGPESMATKTPWEKVNAMIGLMWYEHGNIGEALLPIVANETLDEGRYELWCEQRILRSLALASGFQWFTKRLFQSTFGTTQHCFIVLMLF